MTHLDPMGPYGSWPGTLVEEEEEAAAALSYQPSVLSQVIAGERVKVRPRCDDCGSLLLTHEADVWCPSCVTAEGEEEVPSGLDEAGRSARAPLDAHGLAALPVTLSPRVLAAHEELVRKTHPEEREDFEWDMDIGFNPQTGAFDAMMEGSVMERLRALGPVVRIKGRMSF